MPHSKQKAPLIASSALLRPFYPGLDGLRAIAFLMVFLFHYVGMFWPIRILQWGWAGVDLFFVLSGFLITGILYDSLSGPRYFRNFYIRRSLRIFPIFYGVWVLLLLLTPVVHIAWTRYNLAMALYVGNFTIAGAHQGHHPLPGLVAFPFRHHPGETHLIELGHLWSLCVEEQFYLVWPALVWILRSRKSLLRLCIAVILGSPILRVLYLHFNPEMLSTGAVYYSSFFRVDTLLMGAALALWLRGATPPSAVLRRGSVLAFTAAMFLFTLGFRVEPAHPAALWLDPFVCKFGFSLIAIAAAALIVLAIDPATPLQGWLKFGPLAALGRISYGMYLFHAMPLQYFTSAKPWLDAHHAVVLIPVVGFLGTLAVAALSFRFVERPFLRLKSTLAPTSR